MIIPYNKKNQNILLIYATVLLTASVVSFITGSAQSNIYSINIIISMIALANYLVRRYLPYGVITENEITKGVLFKKSIPIDKITKVKVLAGEIKIYSGTKSIIFDKNQIDKSVMADVQAYFREWILNNTSASRTA